ncbi:hypothetical protein ACPF3T_001372 [Vibrio cholerae]
MTAPQAWYIGWDVGAWNCEKNANSRDALVVLNHQGELVGKPWRGNLRDTIAAAASYTDWLSTVVKLCQFDDATKAVFATQNVVMAIDTPLGFSNGLCSSCRAKPLPRLLLHRAKTRIYTAIPSASYSPTVLARCQPSKT